MKVYLNRKPRTDAWGGGNKTISALADRLIESGFDVVYKLDNSVEIILCFDPRPNDNNESAQTFIEHKAKNNSKIIYRCGDLGTHSKPELTFLAKQFIQFVDLIIFPSNWAKQWLGFFNVKTEVIPNRPLKVFHEFKNINTKLELPINVIAHHWSTNFKKGFDVYKQFDEYISQVSGLKFTYLGRFPEGLYFKNAHVIAPIDDPKLLAEALSRHDIYLTASLEEAGANHICEAISAGLPALYHTGGGSIPEYCYRYGRPYNDFKSLMYELQFLIQNYAFYKQQVLEYNETIDETIDAYMKVITELDK